MYNRDDWHMTICGGDQNNSFISFNHWDSNTDQCNPTKNGEYNLEDECYSIDNHGRSNCNYNDGHYLPKYNDIDLSRNDIGTDGGSYSIDNYLNQTETQEFTI